MRWIIVEKILYKLTRSGTYKSTDEAIKEYGLRYNGIYIFYGFNTYRDDMATLMELLNIIKKDYPDINNDDVSVWRIQKSESQWCSNHTMLTFQISADDFIRMRNSGEIRSL